MPTSGPGSPAASPHLAALHRGHLHLLAHRSAGPAQNGGEPLQHEVAGVQLLGQGLHLRARATDCLST